MKAEVYHGLDMVTKITAPRPPAPRWIAFEVKSRMGNEVPWPKLSAAQEEASYLADKVIIARRGVTNAQVAITRNCAKDRIVGM